MADPQVQGIHLTADIDNPVHNLNDPCKSTVCRIRQILVICSSYLYSSLLHKTRNHLILRLALELVASLQVLALVCSESKEHNLLD